MNLHSHGTWTIALIAVALSAQSVSAQVTYGPNYNGGATTQLTIDEVLNSAPAIFRVEEDWEALIADPLPDSDLPQICTVFGPTDPNFGTHVLFELNHGTLPSFAQGGMQLQVWWSNYLIGYLGQFSPVELDTPGEVVTYTTVTRLQNQKLEMFVKYGQSTTWGQFGGDNSLFIWLWTYRTHLNPYEPNASLTHSRVTFGANRVSRFCRREIRFYDALGELFVKDSTTRYVHRLANDVDNGGSGGGSGNGSIPGSGSGSGGASEM